MDIFQTLVIHRKEQRICCQHNPEAKPKWNCSVCLHLILHTPKVRKVAYILSRRLHLFTPSGVHGLVEQREEQEPAQVELQVLYLGTLTIVPGALAAWQMSESSDNSGGVFVN